MSCLISKKEWEDSISETEKPAIHKNKIISRKIKDLNIKNKTVSILVEHIGEHILGTKIIDNI